MSKKDNPQPWNFLDEYRGKEFEGKWPNVKTMFHISVLRYPNNNCFKAFSPKEISFTYAEAEKKIKEVSYYLLSQGVKKGDKIAVSGKNSPEWAIAYLGIIYAGGIVVPLDILLKDNEMETFLKFGDVKMLFIDSDRIDNIDKDGNVVDEWTSTTEQHPVSGLRVGETYTLYEEVAPEGYVIASSIQFTVEDDFKVQVVEMKDKQVFVSKKSITGDEELPGAELTVTEKESGEVVDKWTSTTEQHPVSGLEVNKTYVLKEVLAPEGYVIANEIEFTVADDMTVQLVEMKDKQVSVSKKDVTTEEELPGAELTVTDKETGKVVDSWTSTEEEHFVNGLEVEKTYILTEVTAPDGYVKAESIEFTVADDLTVQHVEMKDKQVGISKVDITTQEELPGAELSVYDKETGDVVDEWVSTEEEHFVSGLKVGKTYILTEITAPDGYVTAEDIEFTVEDDFTVQHVTMEDDYTKVEISKTDITTGEELPGAKLEITDEEGNVVEEWTSTNEPHMIERLPVGDYVLTEITAPAGYEVAESVEFTVEETGEIQHVLMEDSPTPQTPGIPQTGENMKWFIGGGIVVVLAAISLVLLKLRKKETDK